MNTIHNLHYYMRFMEGIREAIRKGRFAEYRDDFYRRLAASEEERPGERAQKEV